MATLNPPWTTGRKTVPSTSIKGTTGNIGLLVLKSPSHTKTSVAKGGTPSYTWMLQKLRSLHGVTGEKGWSPQRAADDHGSL